MTLDDEERAGRPGDPEPGDPATERKAPQRGGQGTARVPEPTPEETPELLGERSDCPIVWGDEDR